MQKDRAIRSYTLRRFLRLILVNISLSLPISMALRAKLYRLAGIKINKFGNVRIGKVSFDSMYPKDISIGDGTIITDGVVILSHFYDVNILNEHAFYRGQVVIGKNVFIGSHAIITKPIKIGDGAIIAAGSILSKDVGTYEIWGGNPARLIKNRLIDGQEMPDTNHFKSK